MKLLGISSVDLDVMGRLLILCSAFVEYLGQNEDRAGQYVSCLYTSRMFMIRSGFV
jgi:hypothetical protein